MRNPRGTHHCLIWTFIQDPFCNGGIRKVSTAVQAMGGAAPLQQSAQVPCGLEFRLVWDVGLKLSVKISSNPTPQSLEIFLAACHLLSEVHMLYWRFLYHGHGCL